MDIRYTIRWLGASGLPKTAAIHGRGATTAGHGLGVSSPMIHQPVCSAPNITKMSCHSLRGRTWSMQRLGGRAGQYRRGRPQDCPCGEDLTTDRYSPACFCRFLAAAVGAAHRFAGVGTGRDDVAAMIQRRRARPVRDCPGGCGYYYAALRCAPGL